MNAKKLITLMVGCGIALLLAIGAGVLLVFSMSKLGKTEDELKSTVNRLQQLNRRNPFPLQENVVALQSNAVVLKKVLAETQDLLRKGQIEPDEIEPAEFGPMLEKTINRLRASAASSQVSLPDKFAFGFDRYSAGDLPQTGAVRRLVTQLKTIAAVCDIVYAAKVTNLVAVAREEFETQSAAGPSEAAPVSLFAGRSAVASAPTTINIRELPLVASNELFNVERIGIQFAGRENAVFEVLNALTKGGLFTVVRDLTLESTTSIQKAGESRPAAAMGGASEALGGHGGSSTNLVVPRDERIVAGREDVRATLVLDVFRFAKEQGEAK